MKRFRHLAATWPGPLPQRLAAATPLLFALLAAVLLHLLALSYRQLRAERPLQPRPPQLADDSPELLRFSRRQSLQESLLSVPLPPLSSLPPAILAPPATFNLRSAGSATRPRPLLRGQDGSIQASRQLSPRSGSSSRVHSPSSTPAFAGTALAVIRRLQGRGEALDSRGSSATALLPPDPELQRPQAAAAAAWRRLWQRAMVVAPSVAGQIPVTESIELRHLPLADVNEEGFNPGERMAVAFDDRLLLLWPDGQTLWIWQARLRGNPEPDRTKL